MSKKSKIIIGIVLLLVLSVVLGLIYRFVIYEEPLKESWGEKYYIYLKESEEDEKENTIPKDAQNKKVKFVDSSKQEEPIMVINYEVNNEIYTNLYYIEEEKVNSYLYTQPTTFELLYNIEEDEYNYYLHLHKENEDSFSSLDSSLEDREQEEYVLPKNEDGSLKDYDDLFIEPKLENDGFITLDDSNIKDSLANAIDTFMIKEKIITDDIKKEIEEMQEKKAQERVEEVFNNLKGVWYNPQNNIIVEFAVEGNEKKFTYAIFATEQGMWGKISDINLKDNIYSFKMNDNDFTVDISDIAKKNIKIDDKKFVFLHKDYAKAGDIIFEKYF